jgi:hypothetical protein
VYFNPLLFIKSIRFSDISQGTRFVIDVKYLKMSQNNLRCYNASKMGLKQFPESVVNVVHNHLGDLTSWKLHSTEVKL